jgi:hypothetical protein
LAFYSVVICDLVVSPQGSSVKKALPILLGVLVVLSVLVGRIYFESKEAFESAMLAQKRGDLSEAIFQLDHAIHWYFPGNPYVHQSISELWRMGNDLESKNKTLALFSYDAIRGGVFSIRHLYSPHASWLEDVNAKIANLRTDEELQKMPEDKRVAAHKEIYAFHTNALARDERPNVFWVLFLEFGFFGFLASVFLLIWRGFDREGRMNLRHSMPWVMSMVVTFGIWIFGLLKA